MNEIELYSDLFNNEEFGEDMWALMYHIQRPGDPQSGIWMPGLHEEAVKFRRKHGYTNTVLDYLVSAAMANDVFAVAWRVGEIKRAYQEYIDQRTRGQHVGFRVGRRNHFENGGAISGSSGQGIRKWKEERDGNFGVIQPSGFSDNRGFVGNVQRESTGKSVLHKRCNSILVILRRDHKRNSGSRSRTGDESDASSRITYGVVKDCVATWIHRIARKFRRRFRRYHADNWSGTKS